MQSILLSRKQETPTVFSYQFAKPPGFTFQPGQFINLEIPVENCDNRCNKRNSSLVSSPDDELLMIAMRQGVSRFKQFFETLSVGTTIKIIGPLGRFLLNPDPTIHAVILTGGVGITPIHSMIKYATQKKLPKPVTLIYSNKTQDDIPFKKEFDALDEQNDKLLIYHTLTQNQDPNWNGQMGRINEQMIKKLVPDFTTAEFYMSGPAKMVEGLRSLLKTMEIPDERVKFEQFTGY